ncbi:carbonic anhydrase 1 [Amyelois transitella]|uniref:carbonic anhydrase 1 n=1 Tax=Amyelois transitella TaxID=680683 RepID=UPI00298F9C62|nr:carbonic anhydrase 1 [Amyelois transitella]
MWYTGIFKGETSDQTSPRANTLLDDADDIQKQLENEAKDRLKYGRPKTIWVFHLPTQYPFLLRTDPIRTYRQDLSHNGFRNIFHKKHKQPPVKANLTGTSPDNWEYKDQVNWSIAFPSCGGRSQSPVNLPARGLVNSKAKKLLFINYDTRPTSMSLQNDGKRVILLGEWKKQNRPLVYGGAAFNRRYVFHSLVLHWPSEHTISGLQYPIESQVLHISAEYRDFKDAVNRSSSDPLAFLGIVNIYMFSNETHPGVAELLNTSINTPSEKTKLSPKPLSFFSPPFQKYVVYHGSLTTPPCTESVLWIVRGKSLPVNRDEFNVPYGLCNAWGQLDVKPFRLVNPLNDRGVYLFG